MVERDGYPVQHPQAVELEQIRPGRHREHLGLLEGGWADARPENARRRLEAPLCAELREAQQDVRRFDERMVADEPTAAARCPDQTVPGEGIECTPNCHPAHTHLVGELTLGLQPRSRGNGAGADLRAMASLT